MSRLGSILQWDYSSACHIYLECRHLMGTMTTDVSLYPRHQLHNLGYSRCLIRGFPGLSAVKKSTCQCKRCGFGPWVGKIPWRRKWQPTPVFLSGKSREQRSLVGYSPWGCKGVRHNWAQQRVLRNICYQASRSMQYNLFPKELKISLDSCSMHSKRRKLYILPFIKVPDEL